MMTDILSQLRPFFDPNTVAIIGASRTPGKRGHTVTRNLVRSGFRGRIFPVNPGGGDIEGLTCVSSIEQIAERVDCAFLALPARQSVEAAAQCAAAGVRAIVVGSNGFAESGTEEGLALEVELHAIGRRSGMRIIGPNTNGIFNSKTHFSLGYNHSHSQPMPTGPISFVSQSGAMFDQLAGRLRRTSAGLGKFIPVGNEVDLDLLDFVEYLIADPDTGVIGLVIEGLSDGLRFRQLAEQARAAGKPIVVLKVGRSKLGAEASLAHSSRLAGSARACDALFDAAGVASVRSPEALVGGCLLLSSTHSGRGSVDPRIICITSSGAGGALMADFAESHGLKFAGDEKGDWGEPAASEIQRLPTIAGIQNPIDTGSLGDWRLLKPIFNSLASSGYHGPVLCLAHNMPELCLEETLAEVLAERKDQGYAPVVILTPGGLSEGMETLHRENGIVVFHETAACFESLRAWSVAADQSLHCVATQASSSSAAILDSSAVEGGTGFLGEVESSQYLRQHGVPMVDSHVVLTADEAVASGARAGYPVVLKGLAAGVAHKNDMGLVIPAIADEKALRYAFATICDRLQRGSFADSAAKIILQPMISSKLELILGVSREGALGYFLVVGLGGVHAEILDQVTLIPVPMNEAGIRSKLAGSQVGALLSKIDLTGSVSSQIIASLCALQSVALSNADRLRSIDINPMLVTVKGCMAVDALIVLENN